MKASVYTGWCEWASEVKRSMTNEGWRVCVWYQCQGVCFCAWPAVSLNNPTCLGPTVMHSLSGNLQYGGQIKRRPRQDWCGGGGVVVVMKHHQQAERAHCGSRIPLISPPPLWRVVYRESEGVRPRQWHVCRVRWGLRAPVWQMWDLLHDGLSNLTSSKTTGGFPDYYRIINEERNDRLRPHYQVQNQTGLHQTGTFTPSKCSSAKTCRRDEKGADVPAVWAAIIYSANTLLRFHYIAENMMRNIAERKCCRPRSDGPGPKQLFAHSCN